MKTSISGAAFVAAEEGWVPTRYLDFAGVPTIGYGHAIQPGETFPDRLSKAQGLELLRRDLGTAEAAINDAVKVALNQAQFDALVALTFNIGTGAFRSSTLLKKLNAGDYAGASEEFARWRIADGKVSAVLVGRRKRERAMFDSTPPGQPPVDERYDLRVKDPLHLDDGPDPTDPLGLKEPGER